MKKIVLSIVLSIVFCTITLSQQVVPTPLLYKGTNLNTDQSLDQYLSKNVDQTRVVVWSSNMNLSSDWTVVNNSPTLPTQWQWKADTASVSAYFKQYVGSSYYMKSPTAAQGIFYFDGISNLVNQIYGNENSTLTNAAPISTIGHSAVNLKFYQLYKSYNQDSAYVEISNDNISWHKILVNPDITNGHANSYAYGFKEFNITPWAANKAQVWIRFRFVAPGLHPNGNMYSGGYGWMIDDVSIEEAPNNLFEFNQVFGGYVSDNSPAVWSGYTKMPAGQSYPITFSAVISNIGSLSQTNVQLKVKDLTTGNIGSSTIKDTLKVNETDSLITNSIETLSTAGTYRYQLCAISDSVCDGHYKDTLTVNVVDKAQGQYSRDNNYYNGYRRWNVVTGASVNAFQMANLVEITTDDDIYAKSISFVVGSGTTVGAPVRAILYRGWGQTKTVVTQSEYHYIQANEIANTIGNNPPTIELFFTDYSNVKLQKDSAYFVAVQTFGGSDTVWMAVGSSKIPQPNYTMYIYDIDNAWYYYPRGSAPAMIRLNTINTEPLGVVENKPTVARLFQCMPNPATSSTVISYELNRADKVTIEIYDFLGNKIKTYNEGLKQAGLNTLTVNVNNYASGTYFYTLKTDYVIATKKLVVVK